MAGEGHPRGENGGGGPKTEAGLARAKANLDPLASQKHGAWAWMTRGLAPVCRKCVAKDDCDACDETGTCRVAEVHQAAIIREVMALAHISEEHRPIVVEYAKITVGIGLCDLYLSYAGGPFLPGADKGFADTQPAMKYRADLTKTLLAYANALGLTPTAAARLKLTAGDGAGKSWADAVIEAEFTAEEANGGQREQVPGGAAIPGESGGGSGDGGDS